MSATTPVTFYVPIDGEWWIALNGIGVLEGARIQRFRRNGCVIEFSANMAALFKCP